MAAPMGVSAIRVGRRAKLAAALVVIAALGAGLTATHPAPLLIYNPSPSVPQGFYVRDGRPLRVGAFVTLRAVDASPAYARLRDFTGQRDRFIKRVAALGGARLCAEGAQVTAPGRGVVTRLTRDAAGRVLPRWEGCRILAADEVFLLGDTADSFDSRYWGPVRLTAIDGVWRPIF